MKIDGLDWRLTDDRTAALLCDDSGKVRAAVTKYKEFALGCVQDDSVTNCQVGGRDFRLYGAFPSPRAAMAKLQDLVVYYKRNGNYPGTAKSLEN